MPSHESLVLTALGLFSGLIGSICGWGLSEISERRRLRYQERRQAVAAVLDALPAVVAFIIRSRGGLVLSNHEPQARLIASVHGLLRCLPDNQRPRIETARQHLAHDEARRTQAGALAALDLLRDACLDL